MASQKPDGVSSNARSMGFVNPVTMKTMSLPEVSAADQCMLPRSCRDGPKREKLSVAYRSERSNIGLYGPVRSRSRWSPHLSRHLRLGTPSWRRNSYLRLEHAQGNNELVISWFVIVKGTVITARVNTKLAQSIVLRYLR